MSTLFDIPEIGRRRGASGLVRIPPGVDVPVTNRVRRLIDTTAFRRLANISQLGLVSLVYPAANHARFEHSLGVFLAAIEYIERLAADTRFASIVAPADAELFLAAALLHDVGHWPFGHPIEDLRLARFPKHEQFARPFIVEGEVADVLANDWHLDPAQVAALIAGEAHSQTHRVLHSMLSGPIDVDKIDYLMRDSLHAGVPYGRHFDRRRLIGSLCLNAAGDGLAITDKGKTAAEMMVFARYVMFSEVYWHHAVRAATAMLQRALFTLQDALEPDDLLVKSERPMIAAIISMAAGTPAADLLGGIFGAKRQLYKRLAQYSCIEEPDMYRRLARRPYVDHVRSAEAIADALSVALRRPVAAHEVLVDAPPTELEVEFNVDVYCGKTGVYRQLGEISPVVRTLATEQFDDHVKRVRVFAHPRIVAQAAGLPHLQQLLVQSIENTTS